MGTVEQTLPTSNMNAIILLSIFIAGLGCSPSADEDMMGMRQGLVDKEFCTKHVKRIEDFFAACDSDGDKEMTLVERNACEYDDLPLTAYWIGADTNGDGSATIPIKEWILC